MAGPITGITGAVTSWAGTFNTSLISTGTSPTTFSLQLVGDDHDVTGFSTTGSSDFIQGLRSWSGSFTTQLVAPAIGSAGYVTSAASAYATNLSAWELLLEANEHDVTSKSADSTITWRTFIPGLYRWGGTYNAFIDDTTVLTVPSLGAEPASLTLKYVEAGGTDMALSGTAFTTRADASVSPAAPNSVVYGFRGTGAVTQSTPSAGTPVFPAAAVAAPATGSLVLTASTGRTYTGDAFWTRLQLSVPFDAPITLTVNFRGTSTLTMA